MSTCRPATTPPIQGEVTYVEKTEDATTATKLGLSNFSLVFSSTGTGWSIQLTNANNDTNLDPMVILDNSQTKIAKVIGSKYTGSSAIPIYAYKTTDFEFFLSTNEGATPNLTRGVTWFLTYDGAQLVSRANNCPLNVAQSASVGETTYVSVGLSIIIRAESSYDGLQLTLASITIVQDGRSSTEVFYNLPLPCVMSGRGCTLLSKSQPYPISFVAEYALLKFALAKLLFGGYWLCYLTQEWNAPILSRLQLEYPEFYLILSSFVGYDLLFNKTC